jgi:thiol-disulfide isomerase/thioredoxin
LHTLHQYEEAIKAYEEALEQTPEDAAVRADYIEALTWGGILKGDRRWLEKAIAKAKEALRENPSQVEIYESLQSAIRKAKPDTGYVETLVALQQTHPDAPVLSIKLYEARLQMAQGSDDSVQVAAIKNELEADLEQPGSEGAPPEVLYKKALGYALLDADEKAEQTLRGLERTEAGRVMAEPVQYWYRFWNERIETYNNNDLSGRIQGERKWMDRFSPNWQTGVSRARALRGMHLASLISVAEVNFADSTNAEISTALIDSIVSLGTELARTDTWGRTRHYYAVSKFLLEQRMHLHQVVQLTDEGIAALEAKEPGMVYPGTQEASLDRAYTYYLANLKRVKGQALAEMGEVAGAESLLREAVRLQSSATNFTALGQFLLDQGNIKQGTEMLLNALAEGFSRRQATLEQTVRQLLIDVQAGHGMFADNLDKEIRRRKEAREREKESALLADRIDRPAPSFALRDTQDRLWRLADLSGKVVLLNFWATWCGPCLAELPHYQKLVEEYKNEQDVVMLAISTDEDPEMVREWLAEQGYSFTVLHDDGTSIDYHVTGVPSSFFIDPTGRIQYSTAGFPGPEKYLDETRKRIEALRTQN